MGIFDRFFKQHSETSESPIMQELAFQTETFFSRSSGKFESYNPDQLVARKGSEIYRKMLRDPQVKAALNLSIALIVSRDWRFEINSDDPMQEEIKDFFEYNIHSTLRSTWAQTLKNILMAKAFGFSVNEKVYDVCMYEGKERWVVRAIKPKPFETFYFEQDKFGNVTKLIQESMTTRGRGKKLDPKKFIIYVNHPELDPIWGESDLRSAYRPYWEKDNIQKFWNIHLERGAGGFVVATPGPTAGSLPPAERVNFQNALKNLTQASALMVPSGWEIEFVQPTQTDEFEKAVMSKDKQIAKSMLMPNLLGFSEQGNVGSNAQAKTQFDVYFQQITQEGELLADAVNEQLFAELAKWNFGTDEFPMFRFEDFTTDQKREMAEAWGLAVEKGIVRNTIEDENRTRELLRYDPREATEEDDQENPDETSDPKLLEPVTEEPSKEEDEPKVTASEQSIHSKALKEAFEKSFEEIGEQQILDEDPEPRDQMDIESTSWGKRVNFGAMEQVLDSNEADFFEEMKKPIDDMFGDVLESLGFIGRRIEDKEDFTEEMVEQLDKSIQPKNRAAVNSKIREWLKISYEDGRFGAQEELSKAAIEQGGSLQAKMIPLIKVSQKKAVRANIEYNWTVANFIEGFDLNTAEKYIAAKAFKYTGDFSTTMIQAAKQVILDGIKNEWTVQQMVDELISVLGPLTGKYDPTVRKVDDDDRPRLATFVRTNLNDAFNQARLSVFTDPEINGFVEALQYSALLDRRTTDFCRSYNGRVFALSDPIWGTITPPNHFQCRSNTIAITQLDEWRQSEVPEGVAPAAGFGGAASTTKEGASNGG